MLKLKILVIAVHFVLEARAADDTTLHATRPTRLDWEAHAFENTHSTLAQMTEALCKDAHYKMRMATLIQNAYKGNRGYELGIIAANLMEKYRHMIRIYRYYSNHEDFMQEKQYFHEMLEALSIVQGDYNELIAQTTLFYDLLEEHRQIDIAEMAHLRILGKKYGLPVKTLKDMVKKGLDLAEMGIVRRSMPTRRKLPAEPPEKPLKEKVDKRKSFKIKPKQFLLEDPIAPIINTWIPKKNNNTKEEEYKKKMRYSMWAEKWDGFDGETEGIKIEDTLARLGLSNDSDFLLKELKGAM